MTVPLPTSPQTLGKTERLKHRKPIESLFSKGKSIKVTSFVLLFEKALEKNEHPIKMMFIVSKKNYKLAHDRNQIKRWMREGYRTQKQEILDVAASEGTNWNAGIMYTGKKLPNHDYVFNKIKELLKLWALEIQSSK
jgi:ribonuclease P protein component